MLLRTLGALELEGVAFRRPKPLVLLAYLALEGPQERRFLAELFFGGSSGAARRALSTTLTRLRQGAPGSIETDGTRVSTGVKIDGRRLLTALERGEFEAGLELYRGRFLEGLDLDDPSFELEEWIVGTGEFLARSVFAAQLKLAEAEAGEGRFAAAAARAEGAYRLAKGIVEPEQLRRLHTLLLAGNSSYARELQREAEDFELMLCRSREEAVERLRGVLGVGDTRAVSNLPAQETSFVGRDLELVELNRLLTDHRLVTLVGHGGVGKSRLAVQSAHQQLRQQRFDDGILFLSLAALNSPASLPASLAATLSLELDAREPALAQLIRHVGRKRLLLMMDNFEHLVEAATFVSGLVAACPNLSVMVTSRERLDLKEEWLFEVGGLAVPADASLPLREARHFGAVQLFVHRARQARPGFTLEERNLADVIEICGLVEGLPLALELAASWVRVMTPREIATELKGGFDLLVTTTRDISDRHKSIRVSFEHSWQLMSARERQALGRLAVFRGGFRHDAAAEVAGATLPVLAALVDKSLLRVSLKGRYYRHPLLYQYSHEKLAEDPQELQRSHERHARYYLALAEEAAPHLHRQDQLPWLDRLEAEHDNLEAALTWMLARQDAESGLRLAVAASHFWILRGYFDEARALMKRALAVPAAPPLIRARALIQAGVLEFGQGIFDRAWDLFEASLELSRELGDKRAVSAALDNLGNIASGRGEHETARRLLEESLALRRELGLKGATAWALEHLAGAELALGEVAKARSHFQEAARLFREDGHDQGFAWALGSLGALARDDGDHRTARRLFEEALEVRRRLQEPHGIADSLLSLGRLALQTGDAEEAREWLHQGLETSRQHGMAGYAASSLGMLGRLALTQGDLEQARTFIHESLEIRRDLNNLPAIAESLMQSASLAVALGDPGSAATLWGAAEALREGIEASPSARTRAAFDRELVGVQRELDRATFNRAWQRGRALELEEAIDLALAGRVLPPADPRG